MESKSVFWGWETMQAASRALRFPVKAYLTESGVRRSVPGFAVRAVMSVIESHAGHGGVCTVSNSTLAGESSTSVTMSKRSLIFLESEALIIRQTVAKTKFNPTGRQMRPNLDQYLESKLCSLSIDDRSKLRLKMESACRQSGVRISSTRSVPIDERSVPIDERSVPIDERSVPIDERSVPPGGTTKYSDRSIQKKNSDRSTDVRTVGFNFSETELARAEGLVFEVVNLIDLSIQQGKFSPKDNWEAIAKICVATASRSDGFPEHWLQDALESIRYKKRQGETVGVAYLLSVIRKHCVNAGGSIGLELRRVWLPGELQFAGETVPQETAR